MTMKENGTDFSENKMKTTPIAMVAPEVKQNADDTEITKTCAVLGCEDSKKLSGEEFFRFPEDPSQKQIWTDLTGRNNWTPTDYSYICIQHFSVDCFVCNADNQVVLTDKAIPSLKLPRHVLEVEYIEEESLDNEEDERMEGDYTDDSEADIKINGRTQNQIATPSPEKVNNVELLQLFSEVQMMQRKAIGLKEKLKYNMKLHNRQSRFLNRLKQIIEMKKKKLSQKAKKKSRILLTIQDKIKEDTNGLVMAMPTRHTDDLKNFAVSIYKYSPQAYIYIRSALRTMLPSTEMVDRWVTSGYRAKNLLTGTNVVKVTAEQTDTELSCKVSIR